MKKSTVLFVAFFVFAISGFAQNNWVQKASFTNGGRYHVISFTLNRIGYVTTGYNGNSQSDCWKYDPLKNTWTQMASITTARHLAYTFTIDSFAYVGCGMASNQISSPFSSFYKYNPYTNKWSAIKSMSKGLLGGLGFGSGGYGYIVFGYDGSGNVNDLWQYDPSNDSWTQKTDFPGTTRGAACGFSIGKNTYIGLGSDPSGNNLSDFYCYNSDNDSWQQVASYPAGTVAGARAFAVGNKGYVGVGHDGTNDIKSFYEYDPSNDTWTQRKDYAGSGFREGTALSIGSRGYLGIGAYGSGPTLHAGWYMYETLARSITADSIGQQAHCKGSKDSVYFTAINIFDTSNIFTVQISNDNFKTTTNVGTVKGADEGNYKAFITIPTSVASSDSFSFRVISSKPSFTGTVYPLYFSVSPSPSAQLVSSKDSICSGDSSSIYLVKRDIGSTLKWYQNNNLMSDTASGITTKTSGKFHVEVTNINGCYINSSDISVVVNPTPVADIFSANTTACSGDSVQLISVNNTGGDVYSWWLNGSQISGSNGKKIYTKQSGKYMLSIVNSYGCADISSETTVTINPKPDAQIFALQDSACIGDTLQLISVNNNAGDVYEWLLNGNKINGATTATLFATQTGNYKLKITSQNSCTDLSVATSLVFIGLTKPTISASGTLLISSVAANYQWYLDGKILTAETLQFITPKKNGQYTVAVKNYMGCAAISDASIVTNIVGILGGMEQKTTISLFPNPVTDVCVLVIDGLDNSNYTIRMVNTLGQVVLTKGITSVSTNLDLTSINSGIYIIQVFDKNILVGDKKIVRQ